MVYKHAYLNTLLLPQSAIMLSVVKMPLKREVEGHALNSHGNYIVDHGKSWKNHGIVFLNFCGNPAPSDDYYLCNQFGPKHLAQSRCKLFDTDKESADGKKA